MTAPIIPQLGDSVYLSTITANINIFGTISDLDTPDQVSATLELFGGNGVLNLRALMGKQGIPGNNAPLPKLMPSTIDNVDDLPENLTTSDVDAGKYWIIEDLDELGNVTGSKCYMWNRDHYQIFMMGSPGPAGPVPIVTPTVILLDPDDDELESYITVTGDDFHPTWTLYLKAPRGPMGPSTNITNASDYDDSVPPELGDALVWNGTKWAPLAQGTISPRFYTMPENAFVSASGLTTKLPIGSFPLPPLDFPWVPYVHGKVKAIGVEFDKDPLTIGCEVRLGHQVSGQTVARGFGNIAQWANISPHVSIGSAISDAIAPGNGVGVVPANHTGNAGTLYINLFNDGVAGLYAYNRAGSQLSILAVPAIGA